MYLSYLVSLGLCIFFASTTSAQSDPAQAVELFQHQAADMTAQWIHSPDARLRAERGLALASIKWHR